MVRREILAVFEGKQKGAITPKPERSRPSKLVCMHFTSTSTCMKFLGKFYFLTLNAFVSLPLYAFLVSPTLCLHFLSSFFLIIQLILFCSDFVNNSCKGSVPFLIAHGQKGKFGRF